MAFDLQEEKTFFIWKSCIHALQITLRDVIPNDKLEFYIYACLLSTITPVFRLSDSHTLRPSVYDIFGIWVQFTGCHRKEEVRF